MCVHACVCSVSVCACVCSGADLSSISGLTDYKREFFLVNMWVPAEVIILHDIGFCLLNW